MTSIFPATQRARQLPALNDDNRAFWTGGADGRLHICRCNACGHWLHPPSPVCNQCLSFDVAPQPVSGRGSVESFTINHQRWLEGLEVPFVFAMIQLEEQHDLWLTSNIVGCAMADVSIGMPVRVLFEQHEDVWVPLFEKAT